MFDNGPFDGVLSAIVFKVPNVFGSTVVIEVKLTVVYVVFKDVKHLEKPLTMTLLSFTFRLIVDK